MTHQIFSPLDIPDNIPAIWHHSKQCPDCGAPIYYNKIPDGYGIGGTTEQNDGHGIRMVSGKPHSFRGGMKANYEQIIKFNKVL